MTPALSAILIAPVARLSIRVLALLSRCWLVAVLNARSLIFLLIIAGCSGIKSIELLLCDGLWDLAFAFENEEE
jgi:hypothetical protein